MVWRFDALEPRYKVIKSKRVFDATFAAKFLYKCKQNKELVGDKSTPAVQQTYPHLYQCSSSK